MTKIISTQLAGSLLLISLGLLLVFHVLVLIGVVPANIIWGGQVGDSLTNLLILELIALGVTVLFAVIIAAKMGYIKASKFRKATIIGVWIIFAYFKII